MKTPWLIPSEALNRPLNRQTDDLILVSEEATETIRRLGFHIGNIGLLIAQHATSELTEMKQVCTIPFTAPWLLGLINLRGNLVPVFDLNMLMQLPRRTEEAKQMLLILGQGELAGAIVIEDLPIHLTFTTADKLETLPPLPTVLKAFATNGYEKKGEVWFNFDHLGFFESLTTKIAV
jgi:twitching motility protein PilI